jgi:hypothetical protein
MKDWIPLLQTLIQTLVWPILILFLLYRFRERVDQMLDAIGTRIKRGDPVQVGPITLGPPVMIGDKAAVVARREDQPAAIVVSTAGRDAAPSDTLSRLDAKLFILLGDRHLGPINLGIYSHHLPDTLTSQKMDAVLQLPPAMRTKGQRRVYWKQGRKFLDPSLTYGEQGVKTGHTLILTDLSDPASVALLADTLPTLPRT